MIEQSCAQQEMQRLADGMRGVDASVVHRILDTALNKIPVSDLAALAYDWENYWARPKQIAPAGSWRSWGFLTGRGLGKTRACAEYINDEVEAGRAMLIGLAAQDEENSIAIQVQGPSGLIATAAPWFKPQWEATSKQLVWPNGARAYVRTPEVPGKIRGLEYHLSWISELQSWPVALRQEAYDNFLLSTRLGYARMIWDGTPKRRHPILKELLARGEAEPTSHVIVRGTTHENAANLGDGYVEELEQRFAGTQRGREELFGEQLDESENALVKQAWIEAARRRMPETLRRRVISIDPATTSRAGSDRTGIIDAGLDEDGQMLVLGDHSDHHSAEAWGAIALDRYIAGGCDCVIAETNKGGELVTQNLRAVAAKRGLKVVVLGKDEPARRALGIVYVREVHARGPKEDRAQPLGTAYEAGRVSHIVGVDLKQLEELITTWEPTLGQRSPDALDALVHAAVELLGLSLNRVDPRAAFKGIQALHKEATRAPSPMNLATLLAGLGSVDRI